MKLDHKFLDIKYILIQVFLTQLKPYIVDISYSVNLMTVNVQIVMLEGSILDEFYVKGTVEKLKDYKVTFNKIFISKDDFNVNKGIWLPNKYNWLENVLLSKSEV